MIIDLIYDYKFRKLRIMYDMLTINNIRLPFLTAFYRLNANSSTGFHSWVVNKRSLHLMSLNFLLNSNLYVAIVKIEAFNQ